jgi:adenosylhomocysteine nucleosidase
LKWPLRYAEEGVWEGKRYLLAANGPGPKLAAQCVEVAVRATTMKELSSSRLEAVISTGLCGGLDPSLTLAQIVVAGSVIAPPSAETFPTTSFPWSEQAYIGTLASVDRVAVTAADKAALRQTGAAAVEMEAAGVARRTSAAGLPFCCVKVVSDTADEEFVMDFNRLRATDGRFARGKIIVYALTHPLTIPRLWTLRRRSQQAASALGAFLASCRFQFNDERLQPEEAGP